MIAVVASVALIAYAFVPTSSREPEQVVTVAAPVEFIRGSIVAGFVSDTGEITVLTGEPASPTAERLRVNAGAPVLGIATIPEPRWFLGGRVIEYVAEIDGELEVVRVDVRTGRTVTQAYWELRPRGDLAPEIGEEELDEERAVGNDDESRPEPLSGRADGGDETSDAAASRGSTASDLDGEEVRVGSIQLMTAAMSPSVVAVEDGDETRWWVSAPNGGSRLFDQRQLHFLAPMEEALLAVSDGRLVVVGGGVDPSALDVENVEGDTVRSAAVGPESELAFGLSSGSVVLLTGDRTRPFDVGDGAVSDLAWALTGETFFAATTDAAVPAAAGSGASGLRLVGSGAGVAGTSGIKALSVCNVSSGRCSRLEEVPVVGGALVRGIPTPFAPEAFSGIWPESDEPAACVAADADDAEPWRFDPELLVAEYATAVLGWVDPLVSPGDTRNLPPHVAAYDVRPLPGAPQVTVVAQQIGGDAGWLVVHVSAPIRLLQLGYSGGGPITIGTSREGASTVEVVVGVDGVEYRSSVEEGDGEIDEVEFAIDGRSSDRFYYLILYSDAAGQVFAALSGVFGGATVFTSVG